MPRACILDGSFFYCDHELCPNIMRGALPACAKAEKDSVLGDIIRNNKTTVERQPRFINFASDRSCNLSCPSCRTKRIQFSAGRGYESRILEQAANGRTVNDTRSMQVLPCEGLERDSP